MSGRGTTGRRRAAIPARVSPGSARITRSTLTAQLHEALREDIVAGLLAPGQKLRAKDITGLYGVSATPIREALQRLAGEGLVVLDPKIGARVTSISLADVQDVFAVRLLLESRALELSIGGGDASWRADVAAALERLRAVVPTRTRRDGPAQRDVMVALAEAHRAFHWQLLAACGSSWLLRFISILHGHSSRYQMLLVRDRDRPTWLRDHERLARAAERRDPQSAVRVLERHIGDARAMLERAYGATKRRPPLA